MNIKLEVKKEYDWALTNFPSMRSPHEGLSILQEEMCELAREVYKKNGKRNIEKMRKEAIQVAAMALRFINDVCNNETGQL